MTVRTAYGTLSRFVRLLLAGDFSSIFLQRFPYTAIRIFTVACPQLSTSIEMTNTNKHTHWHLVTKLTSNTPLRNSLFLSLSHCPLYSLSETYIYRKLYLQRASYLVDTRPVTTCIVNFSSISSILRTTTYRY